MIPFIVWNHGLDLELGLAVLAVFCLPQVILLCRSEEMSHEMKRSSDIAGTGQALFIGPGTQCMLRITEMQR